MNPITIVSGLLTGTKYLFFIALAVGVYLVYQHIETIIKTNDALQQNVTTLTTAVDTLKEESRKQQAIASTTIDTLHTVAVATTSNTQKLSADIDAIRKGSTRHDATSASSVSCVLPDPMRVLYEQLRRDSSSAPAR